MPQEKSKNNKIQTLPEIYVGEDKVKIAQTKAAQIELLATETPAKYIKKKQGRGGLVLDYVEANYVTARLNATFMFNWDVEVLETKIIKEIEQIATQIKLTARFADGTSVSKTAWGGSEIKKFSKGANKGNIIDISDDLKSSQSDALKKAASMLGVCWDVYSGLTRNGCNTKKDNPEEAIDAEVVEEEAEEEQPISEETAQEIAEAQMTLKGFGIKLDELDSKIKEFIKRKYKADIEYIPAGLTEKMGQVVLKNLNNDIKKHNPATATEPPNES